MRPSHNPTKSTMVRIYTVVHNRQSDMFWLTGRFLFLCVLYLPTNNSLYQTTLTPLVYTCAIASLGFEFISFRILDKRVE